MTSRARGHLAAVLECGCALASCTVGPDCARPSVSVPAAWRKPGGANVSLADLRWWALFQADGP
jgi:hypothetical protein